MIKQIDLSISIDNNITDYLSGKNVGLQYLNYNRVLNLIKHGHTIEIIIDDSKISAINDSFIKGFFTPIFEYLKTKTEVDKVISIKSNNYYKDLFDKNMIILEVIQNDK